MLDEEGLCPFLQNKMLTHFACYLVFIGYSEVTYEKIKILECFQSSNNGQNFRKNDNGPTLNFEFLCIPFTFTVNSHLFLKVLANSCGFLVEI